LSLTKLRLWSMASCPAVRRPLALALSVAKHRVTILSLATPEQASRLPGMARRLRTITTRVGGKDQEVSLFEGRSAVSQCALYVLGANSDNRGRRSALLAKRRHRVGSRPDLLAGRGGGLGRDIGASLWPAPLPPMQP
jgi:hypothetical protein